VDPKQSLLAIIVVESQGLPTMKCQTKCAKAILGRLFWHLGLGTGVPRLTPRNPDRQAIGSWAEAPRLRYLR
jgi:hypothetical protein